MASSEYLQREEAAKKQLGKKGVQKRVKQLPRATRATARGLLREVTGIDVSRKGVSVSPESLAMALPVGKVIRAAKALRAAGKVGQAAALEGRVAAKTAGNKISSNINFWERNFNNGRFPVNSDIPGKIRGAQTKRSVSESVFPRGTDLAKRALKAKAETTTAIKESMNYQFPFNRVINESERIERKYGLTMRTAEEGLRQAAKRVKRNTGSR